jgi:hypothetical protein
MPGMASPWLPGPWVLVAVDGGRKLESTRTTKQKQMEQVSNLRMKTLTV